MALLNIVQYPHEALTTPTRPVTEFGPELTRFVEDLAETMYANNGLGLAANQVGVPWRLFVMDLGERENEPAQLRVFVNPKLSQPQGTVCLEEGCLSFPKLNVEIERAAQVTIHAQDLNGAPIELTVDGLFAVCVQHETDHLDGVTMLDHLGRLSRKLALRRYQKGLAEWKAEQAEADE